MTATLDWVKLLSDLDMVRRRRGMTWAAVSAAADVPSATVWRLAKGESVTAGALLGVMAWAGLADVRPYVRAGQVRRPEVSAPLPGDEDPAGWTTTLTMPRSLKSGIDTMAAARAQLTWSPKPNREGTMRAMLAYALEHMSPGWQVQE